MEHPDQRLAFDIDEVKDLGVIPVSVIDKALKGGESSDGCMRSLSIVGVNPRSEGFKTSVVGGEELFCEVRRSKLLPSGGNLSESMVAEIGHEIRDVLIQARKVGIMSRTPEADEEWRYLYQVMADDDPGGLVAALIARDAPQVLRLSVTYALLDGSSRIDVPHLDAAWAVWEYCRNSVASLFGERTGDVVADRLLDAIRHAGPDGLTTDEQHAALGRHTSAERLKVARTLLVANDLAYMRRVDTGGRPAEVLVVRVSEESETSEERPQLAPISSIPRNDEVSR